MAVRVGKAGGIDGAAGPFQGEADAKAHVAAVFGGHGVAVPFELVFRSPPKTPSGGGPAAPAQLAFHPPPQAPPDGHPPGHPANPGEPPPTGQAATP